MQKIVRRESLGAVHTHTHTHTSNLKKEEKRVGGNPTLKVIEKKDGIQGRINFEGIRSFCVLENSSKGKKEEEQEKGKGEESTKVARRRSLGAVHTHTHTHKQFKEKEKRVGENSTLKGMEKRRTEKRRKLFNCLSFLRALHRKATRNK